MPIKISDLTTASALSGTEQFPIVQSSTTKKTTASAIATYVRSLLTNAPCITDAAYGASTSASAAANTIAIQAAIDANYGKQLLIPVGTFEVATTGSTSAPCGNALTITAPITLIFEGVIKGTNNCNVFYANLGTVYQEVYFLGAGGGVEGAARTWVSTYSTANRNGALIKTGVGMPRLVNMQLINPIQYGLFSDGSDNGLVENCQVIGGWPTYDATSASGPNDNNYGICLNDASTGWIISGLQTVANQAAGKCSQAVASITLGTGTADGTQVAGCQLLNQWEKGTYLIGDNCQVTANTIAGNANGEGLRTVGARPVVANNIIRSCIGGGITLYDAGGASCVGNQIYSCKASGITLAYNPDASISGVSLSYTRIQGNYIEMDSTVTSGGRGIDVRIGLTTGAVASTETGIQILDNIVYKANYHASDPLGAIDIQALVSSSVFRDLRVERNFVNDCGAAGIRFGAATYSYASIRDNKVRDPAQSVARSAYLWLNGVAMTGQCIQGNEARKETGATAMTYGFENVTAAGIVSTLVADNHTRGHGTDGYLNFTGVTNSRLRNRQGDSTISGSFTCTAGATTGVTNTNSQSAMRVTLIPTNAAAVTLQISTAQLFWAGTVSNGVSFTLASGGAGAVGTETFDYMLNL